MPPTELEEVRYLIRGLHEARRLPAGLTPEDRERLDELLAVESAFVGLANWRRGRTIAASSARTPHSTTNSSSFGSFVHVQ
jgi:hypothetical protein